MAGNLARPFNANNGPKAENNRIEIIKARDLSSIKIVGHLRANSAVIAAPTNASISGLID